MPTTRRQFVKAGLAASAGAAFAARSWARIAGANGDIRIAILGLNGRGKAHIEAFSRIPGVRIAALCDPDTAVLDRAATLLHSPASARKVVDLRRVLDDPSIDAISIATPNHWHSLAGIWACQAGKDVYVEKPISHNVWEGRQLVRAAAKYRRIVQCGMQIRSSTGVAEARAFILAGSLGRVRSVHGLCYKRRDSIGRLQGPPPIPPTVDYDLWLGPAPFAPPHRLHFHYDWHWFWPTGNGDLGNQGIHQMDLARWFLNEPGIAPHTLSVGGRLGYVDDGETPNTQIVVHEYAAAPLIFEVRGLPARTGARVMDRYPPGPQGASIGIAVLCEGGRLIVPTYTTAHAYDTAGRLTRSFSGAKDHFANFIAAVRSRREADLAAPVGEGHVSSALCHTANLSYRLGHQVHPGALRESLQGNPPAAEAFGRMAEHLAANGVNLERTPATLGMPLLFSPERERFVANPAADALLTRSYRAPFIVPDLA
jgi:predicted dehydrogenase